MFYHGSKQRGLKNLIPAPTHRRLVDTDGVVHPNVVYLSVSPIIALLFLVDKWRDDEIDLGCYTNDLEGLELDVVITELKPGAVRRYFHNLSGSLYTVVDGNYDWGKYTSGFIGEHTAYEPVKVLSERRITDVLVELKKLKAKIVYANPASSQW